MALNEMPDLNPGLGALPLLTGARTRSISAENPTGAKGKGAMAIPNPADPDLPHCDPAVDLGQGWKVRVDGRSGGGLPRTDRHRHTCALA